MEENAAWIEGACLSTTMTMTNCELNKMTSDRCKDFGNGTGTVYFDRNKDTPLLSLPVNIRIRDLASCKTLFGAGFTSSGVYMIYPGGKHDSCMKVYCDMEAHGGGWTVLVRRQDGSVDFFRKWADYQAGFGNLTGEFWLGNENLVTLTSDDPANI